MDGFATPPQKDALTDWVEFTLLFGPGHMSRAELRDYLEEDGSLDDLATYDREGARAAAEDAVGPIDVLIDDVFSELLARRTVGRAGYPFQVDAMRAERVGDDWRESTGFAFMTCLNARHLFGLRADVLTGSRLFERLVAFALDAYWSGESRHFGWPRDGEDLNNFEHATRALARDMGERVIYDLGEFPTALKDAGLDAVTWRALDTRKGNAILLCQCAIGDDWDTKGVLLEVWRKFLSFAVVPMLALAFPFVPEAVRTHVDWEILCGKVGVPLDRLRLARLLAGRDLPVELRDATSTYVEVSLATLEV